MAEQIISEGRADLVSINRGHIADPYWVRKAISGEVDGIRRCIGCTRCIDEIRLEKLRCSVNPFVGRELELIIEPTEKIKNILVVGGGPADYRRLWWLRGEDIM